MNSRGSAGGRARGHGRGRRFVNFEITWRKDVFSGAPQAGSAEKFGTLGINFRARKAANEDEWTAALAALGCEIPVDDTEEARA